MPSFQVLLESRSILHGIWPAFTCRKGDGEGFFSRVAWTWHSIIYLSVGFYLWAIVIYSLIGRRGPSPFSSFTDVAFHMMTTRSMSAILILFIPVIAIMLDIVGKLFSNLYYPTQTQIHVELNQKERVDNEKRRLMRVSSWRRTSETAEEP